MVSHNADKKKVALIAPECLKEHRFHYNSLNGDFGRLTQVLINLLSNSLKFSLSNSQIKLHLTTKELIRKEQQPNKIKFVLAIEDFGCGISSEKIENLFIDFGKLEEHQSQNQNGRGLGLSICKMIVERMGGSVSVQSEEGRGSIFSIHLNLECSSKILIRSNLIPQVKENVLSDARLFLQ